MNHFLIKILFASILTLYTNSCSESSEANITENPAIENTLKTQLIGEYILKEPTFENTRLGGLSGIDYANNTYYLISDDSTKPIRYYTMNLDFNATDFTKVEVNAVHNLLNAEEKPFENKIIDAESLRFDTETSTLVWTSEGNSKENIPPALFITGNDKLTSTAIKTPEFLEKKGALPNGTLEGLSLSFDNKGYWISMELPLFQDGNVPTFTQNNSPVRISYIDKETKMLTKQYAYNLEKLAIEPKNQNDLAINGLVEILAISNTEFFTLERSFTANIENGGTVIKLFKTTIKDATDIAVISNLKGTDFTPLKKELILNFDSIKEQLPSKTIDNIEGMCFGPKLSNGNRSLVFVADNNFSSFTPQLNQFIALELIEN